MINVVVAEATEYVWKGCYSVLHNDQVENYCHNKMFNYLMLFFSVKTLILDYWFTLESFSKSIIN